MVKRLRRLLWAGGTVAGLVALAVPGAASAIPSSEEPARTSANQTDRCAGMKRIEVPGPDLCTRGPDTFPGVRMNEPAKALPDSVARAQVAANPIVCEGDGVAGKRVEVLYAREQSQASRLEHFLPSFRAWSHEIDAAYNDSAAQTGGSRHIRFVTEPTDNGCQITVGEAVLPDGALETWDSMIPALQDLGYDSPERKYLVFADAQNVCGVGTLYGDDSPGLDNPNNTNTGYARVDAAANCWGFNAAAHELGHNFGAVQESAPNYNGHCSDEWDLMCYGDDTTVVCQEKDQDRLMDCNHDDYFHTNPPADNYLATHWNTADSDWLIKSDTPDPRPGPKHGQKYVITNAATGNAIDVVDSSNDNLAYLSHRSPGGTNSRQWRFLYETGWQLQNAKSEKCADSDHSGTEPGTQVVQYTCNAQDGMRWTLYPLGDGTYALLNTLSGLAATTAGAYPNPLEQQPFTGEPTQIWEIEQIQ